MVRNDAIKPMSLKVDEKKKDLSEKEAKEAKAIEEAGKTKT